MVTDQCATFGGWLRRYRMAAGLTQEALAERAGLSARGISDLERGRRASPYYHTIQLLADALGLADADRATLIAAARPRDPAVEPVARTDAPINLPVPLTILIGRERDSRAASQLLLQPDVRLVTLTGTGGVGKTRLALQVASEMREAFPDGVVFVPLAALRDAAIVLATVAHTLGLSDTGDASPLLRLITHLRAKRLLLVLDNFEHLLAAAPGVSDLLAACPDVKAMATSRLRLQLSGEHEFTVPPLAFPDLREPTDLDQWSRVPAVALFVERVRALDPSFVLTWRDAQDIGTICARVDGLPLAIELAAARSKHFAIPDLAARLEHRLQMLTHGPQDLPARQRTLRDTIAWSYDLLAPDEQRLLRWLAAFAGSWTLDTMEALAGGMIGPSGDLMDRLASLVDGSLVHIERHRATPTRYAMLETIREFAMEQLAASGEEETVHRCHADVMLAWTHRAERGLQSGERLAWARVVPAEMDNVRAALRWSLDHNETERALRIVGNLTWFWDVASRVTEGAMWSNATLAKENADRDGWGYARALYAAGELAWDVGDVGLATQLLTESVARFRRLDDRRSLGQALLQLGLTAISRGDKKAGRDHASASVALLETVDDPWNLGLALFVLGEALLSDDVHAARDTYGRSLAVYRTVGDPWGIAVAITGLGGLAMRERDHATARALLEEGLALRRSIDEPYTTALSLASLGELARRAGDDTGAMAYLEEGLALFRDVGDTERAAWTLYNLGMVAIHRGDADGAASLFRECLAIRAEQGNRAQIAQTIAGLARVAAMRGNAECAARLWGAVEGLRAAQGVAAPTDEDGDEERRTVAILRAALDRAALAAALAAGRALRQSEAVRSALEC